MKFVKWFIILLCTCPIWLGIATSCFNTCTEEGCNPIDYARITDVEYKAEIVDEPGSYGKIVVTERLTYDIHAASKNNLFWELWRDLCEDSYDGVQIEYNVLSVKQILEDGTEVIYDESPQLYWDDYDYVSENPVLGPGKWYHSPGPYDEENEMYECVFFYVDGIYREELVFEVQYEMYNAALRYGDCSDLYISMFSEDSVYDLESFKAEILFPEDKMPSPGNYTYTTYGTDAHSFPVEESDTLNPGYHTFVIDLDEDELKFSPYNEYIEFDLVSYNEDKHIFTQNASWNWYYDDPALMEILAEQKEYADAPEKYKRYKAIVFCVCIAFSGLIAFYAYYKLHKKKNSHYFFNPEYDYDQYREIPDDLDPKFAAALAFCKGKKKPNDADVYSALLLSLVRKGYLGIEETGKDDITIVIKKCPHSEPQYATPADSGFADTSYNPSGFNSNGFNSNSFNSNGINPNAFNPGGYSYTRYNASTNTTTTYNISAYYTPNEKPASFSGVNYGGGGSLGWNTPNENNISWNDYRDLDNISGNEHTGINLTYEPEYINYFNQNNSFSNPINGNFGGNTFAANMYNDLTFNEIRYFNLITRHTTGNRISMEHFRELVANDYDNTDTFLREYNSSVVNVGVEKGYFQKGKYNEVRSSLVSTGTFLQIIGLIFIFIVNTVSYQTQMAFAFGGYTIAGITCLIAAGYLKKNGRKLILLTQKGETEYAKWYGLYNFLNSSTLINERTHIELPLWEQYLVYATAFGLSQKVTKAIEIRCPEAYNNEVLRNGHHRSRRLRSSHSSFHGSVRSGSSIARGGGGFGYGGGGRGGGGGGGGH